ncbi:MAG: MFS transporter [Proteobacteria bacterium]|nr:MFS transporter [Pseudomonadota bacterium]
MKNFADAPVGAWYGLGTLILASMAGNAIVALMPLLTEGIKGELLLTDAQMGALRGVATTLVSAGAAYPIGWLADRIDRRIIFAVCTVIWSIATAGSGFVHSYAALFCCAMGIAVGEAVLGPVVFALIADLFPARARLLANSIFFISQLLGMAAGLAIAGSIIGAIQSHRDILPAPLAELATWRIAMIAHALPVVVLVPLILLIPLPPVKAKATEISTARAVVPYLRQHATTLFCTFIGFGAIGAANGTVFGWIAVAIQRQFHTSAANVGLALGQVFAIASMVGVALANFAARRFSIRWRDATSVRLAQIGATIAAATSCLYYLASSPAQFYWIAVVQIAAAMGGLTLSPTVVQLLAPAAIRARVFAIAGLFYTIFGALSPLAVGLLSDSLGTAPRQLLLAMLLIGIPLYGLGVALIHVAGRGLGATIESVRREEGSAHPLAEGAS